MRTDKNKIFTIGEFAKIHEITKKTLMWYDEVDLLKPAFIGENGYRYYTYNQSSKLETILMLRDLNVSICDIKKFVNNRSADSMEKLLNENLIKLENDIIHLNNIKQNLISHCKNINTLLNIDLSEISIVDSEEKYLAIVPILDKYYSETDIELVISETKKYNLRRLYYATYGSMIEVSSLYNKNFENYSHIFINMPYNVNRKGLHIKNKGLYIRAFHKGNWDNLYLKYCEILDFARNNNIELIGYSYETGINENVIDNINDYITQIEIPIKFL